MKILNSTHLLRVGGSLLAFVGLWALTAWLLSTTPSQAHDRPLTLLTFKSPIGEPHPQIGKHTEAERPRPGEEMEYTIAYSTTTPGSQVFNVRLYDFLPAGTTLISSEPPATEIDDGVLLFTFPAAGTDPVTATVRVRVQEGYEQLRNYALGLADFVTPTAVSLLTEVEQPPAWLHLTGTGYGHILVGGELDYTLRCENNGPNPVRDVTVVDVLPGGVTSPSASPPPDEVRLPLLTWSLGTLAPGEGRTIIITATAPSEATTITNTALAAGHLRALTETLWATTVVTEATILDVSKAASAAEVEVGDELVYTIRYRNIGNIPASGALLTDTLPEAVEVIGLSPSATLTSTGQLLWVLGEVPTGDVSGMVVVTVTVVGNRDGILHNSVAIGAPGGFGGQATADVYVRPAYLYLPLIRHD